MIEGRNGEWWRLAQPSTFMRYLQLIFLQGGRGGRVVGGFPGDSVIKNLSTNIGDWGSLPGLGSSAGVGNNILLQVSCLENYKNRGAWWATVHEVAKESNETKHACTAVYQNKY